RPGARPRSARPTPSLAPSLAAAPSASLAHYTCSTWSQMGTGDDTCSADSADHTGHSGDRAGTSARGALRVPRAVRYHTARRCEVALRGDTIREGGGRFKVAVQKIEGEVSVCAVAPATRRLPCRT